MINCTQTNCTYNKMVNLTPKTSEKNEVTSRQEVALHYLYPKMEKEIIYKRSCSPYLDIYYVHAWNSTNKDMCIWVQFIIENLKCSLF